MDIILSALAIVIGVAVITGLVVHFGARGSAYRQQVLLLVIDKVIIGALIAAAFVLYDTWKTEELRRYDDGRRETDLEFTRSGHVREFLPVVMDSQGNPLLRIEALAALVDTQSISSETAVRLANRLIVDGILEATSIEVTPYSVLNEEFGRTLTKTVYRGSEEDLLAALIDKVMPSGLLSVVTAYERVRQQLDTLTRESETDGQARLEDARNFWVRIFRDGVAKADDAELVALESESLIVRNLRVVDDLAKNLLNAEAEHWFGRSNAVIRTTGALGLADADEEHRSAVAHLASFMKPSSTAADLRVSAEVVDLLRRRNVHSPELLRAALDFAISARQRVLQSNDESTQAAARRLVQEISDYLYWAVGDCGVADVLVPVIGGEFREFVAGVSVVAGDSLGNRDRYRVERMLVRVLSPVWRRGDRCARSRQARELLSELYEVGEDRLRRIGLAEFAMEWKSTEGVR